MKAAKLLFQEGICKKEFNNDNLDYNSAQVVIGFGERRLLTEEFYNSIQSLFPNAEILLASSSGEIFMNETYESSVVITALEFAKTAIKAKEVAITQFQNSFEAGQYLMKNLQGEHLKWVFVVSDGNEVNGSEFVKGINKARPEGVLVTGGLAGDGIYFKKTVVGLNKKPVSGTIAAIGFYGEFLELSHAFKGGWEPFGLERTVTKSEGNILYEIDGKNALNLYKRYLGKYAEELPSSALLFPLSLKANAAQDTVVRTILAVNEKNSNMTFAGDIPLGSKVRFMKVNLDTLIDAAEDAASTCRTFTKNPPKLTLLISCVGRKLVLGNRASEEIDTIKDVFGNETSVVGFYSYGEIAPLQPFGVCELHNQTITITGINEIE